MTSYLSESIAKKNAGRPLKTYLWRVELPQLIRNNRGTNEFRAMTQARQKVANTSLGQNEPDTKDINHRISSISAPMESFGTDEVPENNSRWVSAQRKSINELTMEVQEYEDMKTLQYFQLWNAMIMNRDGTYNPPAFWKRNIVVYRLSAASKLAVSRHIYRESFVNSIGDIQSDYETADILKYSVSFSVDDILHDIFDIEDQVTGAEKKLLKRRINFQYDDPANIDSFLGAEPIDDAYNVFDNVINRVPGL